MWSVTLLSGSEVEPHESCTSVSPMVLRVQREVERGREVAMGERAGWKPVAPGMLSCVCCAAMVG